MLATHADNRAAAKCQVDAFSAALKCQDTKLKAYARCKMAALANGVLSAAALRMECLEDPITGGIPDAKGRLQKACVGKLERRISRSCSGNFGAFGGCNATNAMELQACLDARVACQICQALDEVDGFERDCDLFDDGLANDSCLIRP